MPPARLVGVLHLAPLPGSPRAAEPLDRIAAACAEDAALLQDLGYDLVMIENFGDAPFYASRVPPITVAAMTACVLAARHACPSLALGVNVLRNDAEAALSIAAVAGADVVRVNVHTGARVTDQGLVEGRAAETLRLRRALGVDVAIWADVDVKHSAALAPRPATAEAEDLVERGLADAVLVTGEGTGKPVELDRLAALRAVTADAPLLVASGATIPMLPLLAAHADGVIVGSALRAGGRAGGRIDAARAEAFADAFRIAFD